MANIGTERHMKLRACVLNQGERKREYRKLK